MTFPRPVCGVIAFTLWGAIVGWTDDTRTGSRALRDPSRSSVHRHVPNDSLLGLIFDAGYQWGRTREEITRSLGTPDGVRGQPNVNRHTGDVDSIVTFEYSDRRLTFWWSPTQNREFLIGAEVVGRLGLPGGIVVTETSAADLLAILGPPIARSAAADTTIFRYRIREDELSHSLIFGALAGVVRVVRWRPSLD